MDNAASPEPAPGADMRAAIKEILPNVVRWDAAQAVMMLGPYPDQFIADTLTLLNPWQAQRILARFPADRRQKILAAASPPTRKQWALNERYRKNTVGHMMEPPLGVFRPETTVEEAVAELRHLVTRAFITYVFVVDEDDQLLGVVAMREMLMARGHEPLARIMVQNPFRLNPKMEIVEAMRETMLRHYPVYPVCEDDGTLIGLVRGQMLFEAQSVALTLQPGTMVGVEKEERLATRWTRSLRLRHPWLQGNLLAGFIAAAVVGYFQGTIDRLLALAVFLPVVIGQSSNTGVQTLAIALRGMTLGELTASKEGWLLAKESLLGLLNGALTGVTAALGMFIYASSQNSAAALQLSVVILVAMALSCLVSGFFGVLTPLILRRCGADPAAASSIVLTTITDVATLAVFLGLATWMA